VAGDAEAPALERLVLAGVQRLPDLAELRTEPWAEHREVRADPQLGGVDGSEDDLLDPELVGDLRRVRGGTVRTLDHQPAQGLPELELGLATGVTPQLHDPAQRGDVGQQLVVGRQ
jgi:hypothetical protein